MAGIAGQPESRPSDIGSPVPQPSVFDSGPQAAQPPQPSSGTSVFDQPPASAQAAAQQQAQPQSSGIMNRLGNAALNNAPAIGGALGAAGAIAASGGAALAPMIGAAFVGGGLGQTVKSIIEQDILGKNQSKDDNILRDVLTEGGKQAGDIALGEGLFKAAGAAGKMALETQAGKYLAEQMSQVAVPGIKYVSNFMDSLKKQMIEPVTDFLAENKAPGTAEDSGNQIKQALIDRIGQTFQNFKQMYGKINDVLSNIPVSDDLRYNLTSTLKDNAVDEQPYLSQMIKRYADKIDASGNAQDIHSVIDEVNGQISKLSQGNLTPAVMEKIRLLQDFSKTSQDYMEDVTSKIASRISKGMGTPAEMDAFEQMMQAQQNPSVPLSPQNLSKYTQSVAKDYANNYLQARDAVKADYAKFRGFLEDVGEQTKVRAQGRGPMQFVRDLQDVPAEQLTERMFQPKNAAALRSMQQETPDVFVAVKQARIRDIYNKSMSGGQLDLTKLADNFDALPESSRPLIISDEDRKMIRTVAESSGIKALDVLHNNWVSNTAKHIGQASQLAAVSATKIAKDAAQTSIGRGIAYIGRGVGAKAAGAGIRQVFTPSNQQQGQ